MNKERVNVIWIIDNSQHFSEDEKCFFDKSIEAV